jgi:hypothetical protein
MSGWVYGPGGGSTSPGGSNGDIQFNSSGSFSGSALLTTDGAGSLSASANMMVLNILYSLDLTLLYLVI